MRRFSSRKRGSATRMLVLATLVGLAGLVVLLAPRTPVLAQTTTTEGVARPSNPGGAGAAVDLTGDVTSGKQIFANDCQVCHGPQGTDNVPNPGSADGTVPPLNPIDSTMVSSDYKTFATNIDLFIEHGSTPEGTNPQKTMPAWGDEKKLDPQQIADVIAYIISLNPTGGTTTTTAGGTGTTEPSADVLKAGKTVFETICAACHQADGKGVSGKFPPLVNNPNITGADFVAQTVRSGLKGPITVNGVEYNGVMPQFSTLSDAQITAVAAYVVSELPEAGGTGTTTTTAAGAGTTPTTLPIAATVAIGLAFLLAIGLGAWVLGPRILATTDRVSLPWGDAWLKTAVIVLYFVIGTVILPSAVMRRVAGLSRPVQDLIGSGLWAGALAIGLFGLWWAHRRNRI